MADSMDMCCGCPVECANNDCPEKRAADDWQDYWDGLSPEDRERELASMAAYAAGDL